ncbi:PLD nuclease N-terminal domain-containing protein [Bacillus norwichensis]|uniref:PLDc_N domain-containing protein n=1 Tax=Bacillus norwichensis TaxID=2762217 RepID=A0ABR8VPL9_9BACI|nr:PLD nuclease N-terminal domain-containing protein [Bacillus norwichensis]MBD8006715.1 PLDc_N domain-containing protein [Bacillus norwichensis]
MHYGYHIGIDELGNWLPLILPVVILHLILFSVALWDLLKRNQSKEYKWMWGMIIILINMIGPILYFIFGRRHSLDAPTSSKPDSKKVRKS